VFELDVPAVRPLVVDDEDAEVLERTLERASASLPRRAGGRELVERVGAVRRANAIYSTQHIVEWLAGAADGAGASVDTVIAPECTASRSTIPPRFMIGGEAGFARAPRSPAWPNTRSSGFPQTTRNALARVEALGGKVVHPGRAVGGLPGLRGQRLRACPELDA
jgi:hypothetical protein